MVEKYLRYSNDSKLPVSGLVEFNVSEKKAPEEFSLFHKIFTPVYFFYFYYPLHYFDDYVTY